jgi:hypothetical protein
MYIYILPLHLPLQIRSHASLCRGRNHGTEGKYDWADRSSQTTFEHIILKYKKKQKKQGEKWTDQHLKLKLKKQNMLKDAILSYRCVFISEIYFNK